MEKLIELLNEYNKEKTNGEIGWKMWEYDDEFGNILYGYYNGGTFSEMYCVSKRYGFIEWLVENDKINREKFGNSETKSSKYSDFELSYDTPREDYTNTLLMELAIQDDPIQFLIKILR